MVAYVVTETHFRALQARGARKANFFQFMNLNYQDGSNEVLHTRIFPHIFKRLRDTKVPHGVQKVML